jgi:hypothetical protein
LPKLADRAREQERFAAALLKTETDSRDSQARIKAARFPRARRSRTSTWTSPPT